VTRRTDGTTCEVLAGIEDINFQVVASDSSFVVLRTTLAFDLHVRPATHLFSRLRESGCIDRLSLRRPSTDQWVDFQPLSLVALALHKDEAIEIRLAQPVTRDALSCVIDAFRSCPLYREYGEPSSAPPADTALETADFEKEFESNDGAYCLIKLSIENFVIGHLAEIESYILNHSSCALTDWDCIHNHFKNLLFGEFEHFGIMSLDVPLDNLLQTRDMCYHLHFKQLEKGSRISYALMNIEWGQENALAWRKNHMRRHRYFYERENNYYRDLFLTLVLRDYERLQRLVSHWRERMDYSLRLRRDLPAQMAKVECEMSSFSPNFDKPPEFLSHIRLMGDLVVRDLSRLTSYLELIRESRIFHIPQRVDLLRT